MLFLNYTPHNICLNNGETFVSVGVARVGNEFTDFDDDLVCKQTFGMVEGLPKEVEGTKLIVSGLVLSATLRKDLVAPATGHKDVIRNDKGHIVSVPGFVCN